jgi:hypothetical protein
MNEFQADFGDHNFQEIYDTIREYYPVGEEYKNYTPESLRDFPGYQKIWQLIDENFVNKKNYKGRWVPLSKYLKTSLKKRVVSSNGMFDCCASGEVIVSEFKSKEYTKTKKLCYFISLLGPYYAIYGIDSSEVILPTKFSNFNGDEISTIPYSADHVVTISPVFEYESLFVQLQNKIKEHFAGYKFIPYSIGISAIEGISYRYRSEYDSPEEKVYMDNIYAGLFGLRVTPKCIHRGEDNYGFVDWLKPLSDEELNLSDLIKANIQITANGSREVSIHKVWKLKSWKKLPLELNLGGMWGMDLIEILDLTSPQKVIISAGERKTPGTSTYYIDNGNLVFNEDLFFEIKQVTDAELTVIMHIKIPFGTQDNSAPVVELVYNALTELKGLV